MLNGDFYKVFEREGDWCFRVSMNEAHPIYKGHFPERPVTPGACLLQMTQELLSLAKNQTVHLVGITNLKFVALHTPDKTIDVQFKELGDDKYQVTISDSTTVYVKMSGQYLCADTDI